MSLLHIANYQDAPRRSCLAAQDMSLGEVIKIVSGASQRERYAQKVTAVGDVQAAGLWGVVMKISADPFQVNAQGTSTIGAYVPKSSLGSRLVTISSGDAVVEVGAGAVIEYDVSLLHTSLVTSGSFNQNVGVSLGVNTSGSTAKWSTAAATSLAGVGATIHVARVYKVFGKKVLIELVNA